jgi:hypothetical protein
MQYILTEEEYDDLVLATADAKDQYEDLLDEKEKEKNKIIQELCTKIADTMPIKYWGSKELRTWGCKITEETPNEDGYTREWYCDECPVQKICPHDDKDWSK